MYKRNISFFHFLYFLSYPFLFMISFFHVYAFTAPASHSPPMTPIEESLFEVEIFAPTREIRSELAALIPIDEIHPPFIKSVVNAWDIQQLEKFFPHLVISKESLENSDQQHSPFDFPSPDALYNNYQEVRAILFQLVKTYPHLMSFISLGTSLEGREILGVHIGRQDIPPTPDPRPGILFVGTHHAREHLSTEVPLQLIRYLAENYNTNGDIKKLVDSRHIYIIPLLNPDGSEFDIETGQYRMWRKNRRPNQGGSYGVDLNRNYRYMWGTGGSSTDPRSDVYMGPTPFSEPETSQLKNFVEINPHIKILLSFHTYSELILYPWGHKYDGIGGTDEQVFKKMAETMAQWNNYTPQQSSDLYIASGDTCDWAYGELKIFCFTFELSPRSSAGGGFYPGPAMIAKAFQDNIKPILYLIDKAKNPYDVLERSTSEVNVSQKTSLTQFEDEASLGSTKK